MFRILSETLLHCPEALQTIRALFLFCAVQEAFVPVRTTGRREVGVRKTARSQKVRQRDGLCNQKERQREGRHGSVRSRNASRLFTCVRRGTGRGLTRRRICHHTAPPSYARCRDILVGRRRIPPQRPGPPPDSSLAQALARAPTSRAPRARTMQTATCPTIVYAQGTDAMLVGNDSPQVTLRVSLDAS